MWIVIICLIAAVLKTLSASAFAQCDEFATYKHVALKRFAGSRAYAYRTDRIAIDADGAPNAYHPEDRGIDALANAGFPNGDWPSVLVSDPADRSRPFVQQSGEFAGFFVSMTALEDRAKATTDPDRYVDARAIPYVVFPGRFFHMVGTGGLGALGAARSLSTKQTSLMIFADIAGPDEELGEVSIKLAENLGGHDVDPRTGRGAPSGPFAYVIFPGSEAMPPWPLSPDQLQQRASAELEKIGGWDAVLSCLTDRR